MEMHDMTENEAAEVNSGPCLYLSERDLLNLGITSGFDDFEVGEEVTLQVRAKVSGISEREYGRSVDLSITEMGLEFTSDAEEPEPVDPRAAKVYRG